MSAANGHTGSDLACVYNQLSPKRSDGWMGMQCMNSTRFRYYLYFLTGKKKEEEFRNRISVGKKKAS